MNAPTQGKHAVLCLVTAPPDYAGSIASAMLERELAACVNIVEGVRSLYRWEGELQDEREALLVVKTTRAATASLDELLREIHPYDTFELLTLDVDAGSERYLRWIADSVALL
ncbi:MAG TPA: divalent-cation tolerance protein CutA [Solirubrobacteraceae bacterium]|nr:divalent-cation tolerance protein CutA [Solirubrobacteraceae bacterium]